MKKWANIPIKYLSEILGIQISRKRTAIFDVDNSGKLSPEDYRRISCAEFNSKNVCTLKAYAVKLYLYLFFLSDSRGIGEYISINELSTALGCTERTIFSSFRRLSDSGYISFEKLNPRYVAFSISGYGADLFRSMKKGGKGFITMSEESAREFLSITGLNDLRLALSCLIRCNVNGLKSTSKISASIISVADFKDALPAYIRPSDIKRSILRIAPHIGRIEERYKEYSVFLSDTLTARKQYETCRREARCEIKAHVDELMLVISDINVSLKATGVPGIRNILRLREEGIEDTDFIYDPDTRHLTLPYFSSKDIESLASLAAQFGTEEVIAAVNSFISIYCLSGIKFTSPAAAVSNILSEWASLAS